MIIQGSGAKVYCADCYRTPVAHYGSICAVCDNFRRINKRGVEINLRPFVVGALLAIFLTGTSFAVLYGICKIKGF